MKTNKVKSVVFVSNYFNHHQRPISDELNKIFGDGYKFIETAPMEEERVKLGWGVKEFPSYVVTSEYFSNNTGECIGLVDSADVVIIGSAPEWIIENRKKNKKLIFRYSERPLKKGIEPLKFIPRLIKWNKKNPKNAPIYMLCASAYAASDYAKFGLFKNRCYRWGYFPETKIYDDINDVIAKKSPNSLLWVARFIDWKHPEIPVEIAKRLKADGYDFSLNMIGNGPLEDEVKRIICENDLSKNVHLLGSMSPQDVRANMEKSEIFLFTSDRNEGWGAVLNESMNSGCAVVANEAIGSAPFLINKGENGLLYSDGDIDELYSHVKLLLDNQSERKRMSVNAYSTILYEWNAENAAKRVVELAECKLNDEDFPDKAGVCGLVK